MRKLGDHSFAVQVAALTLALDDMSPRELLRRIEAAPWKLTAPEGTDEEGRSSIEELLTTSLHGWMTRHAACSLRSARFSPPAPHRKCSRFI